MNNDIYDRKWIIENAKKILQEYTEKKSSFNDIEKHIDLLSNGRNP
jgi:hypothetical protein